MTKSNENDRIPARKLIRWYCCTITHGSFNDSNQRINLYFGLEIFHHAADCPNMAPTDFHLFRFLQHHLVNMHFQTSKEIENSITEFIEPKSPSFFWAGIRQLLERWQKCIESAEDYFQDWHVLWFFINKYQFSVKKKDQNLFADLIY